MKLTFLSQTVQSYMCAFDGKKVCAGYSRVAIVVYVKMTAERFKL